MVNYNILVYSEVILIKIVFIWLFPTISSAFEHINIIYIMNNCNKTHIKRRVSILYIIEYMTIRKNYITSIISNKIRHAN